MRKLSVFGSHRILLSAITAASVIAAASTASAQTIVTSFAPISMTPIPGVWFEADVRTGGVAAIVDLAGNGGNLENSQPLPSGAAKLTTDLTTVAKAEVVVIDSYGVLNNIIETIGTKYR